MINPKDIKIGQKLYLTTTDPSDKISNLHFLNIMNTGSVEDFPVRVRGISDTSIYFVPMLGNYTISDGNLARPFSMFSESPQYKYKNTFRVGLHSGMVYKLMEDNNPKYKEASRVVVLDPKDKRFTTTPILQSMEYTRKLYDNDIVFS